MLSVRTKLRKLHELLEIEFGGVEKRTGNVCLKRQRQRHNKTKTNKDNFAKWKVTAGQTRSVSRKTKT